jgi:tricorn protease
MEALCCIHDKKGGENYFRKHHVSAITRDIWKYDANTGKHEMIIKWKGEDRNPVIASDQNTIYFLSERSGSFNVHSFKLDNPTKVTQVSDFKPHPVRYLSISNDGLLCYTYNGSIYTQKENAEPAKVNIEVRTEAKENRFQMIGISGKVTEMAISPNGKEVAYIARGEVFVSSV